MTTPRRTFFKSCPVARMDAGEYNCKPASGGEATVRLHVVKGKSSINKSNHTVCPRSFDPFYKVSYYIKWVQTSWTYSSFSPIFSSTLECLNHNYGIKWNTNLQSPFFFCPSSLFCNFVSIRVEAIQLSCDRCKQRKNMRIFIKQIYEA